MWLLSFSFLLFFFFSFLFFLIDLKLVLGNFGQLFLLVSVCMCACVCVCVYVYEIDTPTFVRMCKLIQYHISWNIVRRGRNARAERSLNLPRWVTLSFPFSFSFPPIVPFFSFPLSPRTHDRPPLNCLVSVTINFSPSSSFPFSSPFLPLLFSFYFRFFF